MRKSLKNKKPLAMFKRRHTYTRVSRELVWGNSGIKLLSRLIIPRRRFRWIRIWMKWHYKLKFRKFNLKLKKKERYYWFRLRSCMPCTRKSDKSRMGKGKGKIVGWSGNLTAGHFIMEFNLTKFSVIRPLFKYLTSKFSARIHGVIKPTFKLFQGFGGNLSNIRYFHDKRLYTYKRRCFAVRLSAVHNHKYLY